MPAPWKPPLKPLSRISLADMQAILASDQLRAVQEPIAAALGQPILPHTSASDSLNTVCFLDWDAPAILNQLVSQRDRLIAFGQLLLAGPPEDDDGEFPPGEEPAPQERGSTVETLGLVNGFALHLASLLRAADDPDPKLLLNYLKSRRVPHASRHADEICQILARVGT